MPLCDVNDINVHLPSDKISQSDITDDQLQIDAERVIKGLLSGTFSAVTLATWDTPNNTPGYVRGIAGRFIAAKYYAERFSEDTPDVGDYAQWLYDQAMNMIRSIISGDVNLGIPDEQTGGSHLTEGDFYPDDTADGPYFTMSRVQ